MNKTKRSRTTAEKAARSDAAKIEKSTPVSSVKKTAKKGARGLPVTSDGKLTGTVAERDPEAKAGRYGHDPASVTVGDSLSPSPHFCYADQSMEEARRIMRENRLDYLAVVDRENRLVGVIESDEAAR